MEIGEAFYWGNVVISGLKSQRKLLERSKHLIDRMGPDEFVSHRDSAYEKIGRAYQEGSVHPLRELKTKEKGVFVEDLKQKMGQGVSVLSILL